VLGVLMIGDYKYDVYRSPNIGLFVKSNNSILSSFGFAETKAKKLRDYLDVDKMLLYQN
jgi:translation initiation factor 6